MDPTGLFTWLMLFVNMNDGPNNTERLQCVIAYS